MPKNHFVSARTADDIDGRIDLVLRRLDYPEPPLRLEDVRELLDLDRMFFKVDDPTILRETISRIRIGGIQVFRRPTLLLDAVRKSSLKALYLPDRKRILLDESLPKLKHRWNEAHEICHSLLPWHHEVMLGDDRLTLLPNCREEIEAEANYGAGRLLFLRDRFTHEARSLEPTIDTIRALKVVFGNTLTATLYRFVESAGSETPLVGLITGHPHVSRQAPGFDPSNPCRHFIRSPAFVRRFADTSDASLFADIAAYCGAQSGGPLGEADLILSDDNGDGHRFHFETFFNRYDALTLGRYIRPGPRRKAVAIA